MVHSSADSKQTNEHRTDRSRVDTQKTTVFCALVFFYKKAMFRIEGHIPYMHLFLMGIIWNMSTKWAQLECINKFFPKKITILEVEKDINS